MLMRSLAILCLALATVLAKPDRVPAAEPLTWEALCEVSPCRFTGRHGVREAKISPDGRQLAVTARAEGKEGIFLVRTDGSDPQFWTEGSSPVWFADGTRIVFTRDNDLWTIRLGSDEALRITSDDEGERAPRPSPDGRSVAFFSTRSGHQDLWLVPADGSASPRRLTDGAMTANDGRFTHSWSPDSRRIAYYSNKADYWEDDLWIVDVASGQERQLSTTVMGRTEPAWSPDGRKIAIMATSKSVFWYADLSDIYLIDPETGEERRVEMQIHATERAPIAWSGDGSELFFLYHQRAETELWRVASEGGVATRVTNMGGMASTFDATSDGDAFVFVRSTPTRGTEADYLSALGGRVERLTHFATEWDGVTTPEEISYRSRGGLYIQGFLFLPPDFDPAGEYPALVQVHGGGTNTYYNGLNLIEQYLAQRGYVVLAINYRGGSGFGREFQDLSVNDWANGQAYDAAAAADFLRAQPWSSGKVGIYGYSYGGIMSMAAITRIPDAFDAAVPMAGIYDFADAYETADRVGKLFTREGHGGSPEDRPQIYARSNSLARVENIETPLLLMHGEADRRAPFRQYEMAVELLEKHGKVFESHSFPGEPHGFRQPENRVGMYRRLEAWFDRWLR